MMNQGKNTFWYKHIYGPIRAKVEEWIWYDDNQPKSNYFANREEHDAFRSRYDRDCMLTGGELKADTLFSLWAPLKKTILRLNDEETIRSVGNICSKYDFLRGFIKDLSGAGGINTGQRCNGCLICSARRIFYDENRETEFKF